MLIMYDVKFLHQDSDSLTFNELRDKSDRLLAARSLATKQWQQAVSSWRAKQKEIQMQQHSPNGFSRSRYVKDVMENLLK